MGKIGKIIGAVVAGTAAVAGGIAAGKKIADSKKEKRTIIIESYNEGLGMKVGFESYINGEMRPLDALVRILK